MRGLGVQDGASKLSEPSTNLNNSVYSQRWLAGPIWTPPHLLRWFTHSNDIFLVDFLAAMMTTSRWDTRWGPLAKWRRTWVFPKVYEGYNYIIYNYIYINIPIGSYRIHGAGIYIYNMTGVYWWDPWSTIYGSTMDPICIYNYIFLNGVYTPTFNWGASPWWKKQEAIIHVSGLLRATGWVHLYLDR